ncbi:hypothetical protein [Kitasatospora sp. NPDC085879]|uniref:hypothetical protein n=1 Tax=Kitasatospora sp. NPDC085879 TaxID=3154769 RepID=UPI003417CD25
MRSTTLALATVCLLVGAVACSPGTSSPAQAGSVEVSSSSPSRQDQFLTDIHIASIGSWATSAPTGSELLAYPDKWCSALDDGHSVAYILNSNDMYPVGPSWGTKLADAERVLVLAVTDYCPSHRTAVVQELQARGDW